MHLRQSLHRCLIILMCIVTVTGCERANDQKDGQSPATKQIEYQRHLRQGREQMRRGLYANAAAEFETCRQSRPEDPELLFQLARLELAQTPDFAATEALLQKAIAKDGHMVKAHRFLYIMYTLQKRNDKAATHRSAVEREYGALGTVEMEETDYAFGWSREKPEYTHREAPPAEKDALARYAQAAASLQRTGHYDAEYAVSTMEDILRAYPDLTAPRLSYAKQLVFKEVRVQTEERPGLPPVSSRLILDYAQSHLERALDQTVPRSPIADQCVEGLAETAMRMADYDEAVAHYQNLVGLRRVPQAKRLHFLGQMGAARYKQQRYDEAIDLLEQSVSGSRPGQPTRYGALWVLHLTYEAAETPRDQRKHPFQFRRDLPTSAEDAPLRFRDVAAEWGINKLDGLGPSAWCDYDRDGDIDLFVCGCDSYGALYRNDGDRFHDVTHEAGLLHVQSGYSATLQDYDNDGYCDLYIGRDGWNGPAPNGLYHNEQDGTFKEVTQEAGVGHPGSSFVHGWLDYDRDGFLDLYVANGIVGGGDTNVLYRNNGNGTFTDVTADAGLGEPRGTKTIGFAVADYDKDGWSDLFVGGYNAPHRLYHNKGDGTFEEVAKESGLSFPPWEAARYVSLFFDYDNDTWPDILMTRLAPWSQVLLGMSEDYDSATDALREQLFQNAPKLYRNNGDGTFSDVSRDAQLLHPIGIMGANVADVDNDGYQDLYFGTGDPMVSRMEPDRFLRNNGDGTFTDWTFPTGLGNVGKGHGVTFVDIDADGDLDMYVPEGGFVHGDAWENAFYLNLQDTGNTWLHLDLEGATCNRDAVGTSVTVTANGMSQIRQVKGGRGFGSSDSPTVEFGLARAQRVDRLEIQWPSGARQVFEDLPVNKRIYVREGDPWQPWPP